MYTMYKLKYFKTQGQNLHSTFENIEKSSSNSQKFILGNLSEPSSKPLKR